MAHFAKIENDIVTQVVVAEPENIALIEGEWVQTSYNTYGGVHKNGGTPLRGNYAGIGYTYDRVNDVFIPKKPSPSCTLNTSTWTWEYPTAYPFDGGSYTWDEQTQSWIGAQA